MLAKSVPNKVHSFDLVSRDPIVTPCDMAHLPLPDKSVDIVVFCLSLMGTNIVDFVREAHRVLKVGGIIKIAEVRSRFEGGEAQGLEAFLKVLRRAGFDIVERRHLSTMFFMVEGVRSSKEDVRFDDDFSAKACLYKKR
jgi:ribosomal RNA-processing protein 8